MRLNYRANVRQVKADKTSVKYLFAGGLLWVDLPPGEIELTITYSIAVEEGPNETNSGCFLRKAGHVRNQYFWHPFFDFSSAGDQAEFKIQARIPKEYKLSTSLPQTERIEGAERVVDGKTIRPTFALTLSYDRDWNIATEQIGGLRLELFLTPEFKPSPTAVVQEFRSVYSLLSSRFGTPKADYFAIVQARSIQGNGWLFASNQVVVAGGWPRTFSTKDGFPRAFLGHEIGHLWTNGSGAAANFLGEGWATYVESIVLAHEFGADTVKEFWKKEAEDYFRDDDSKVSILEDESNGGVSYSKGAWVFRMLNEAVGEEAFQKAMTEYSSLSLAQAAGWEVLAECFQRQGVRGFDARAFLTPWLMEKSAPGLTAETRGDRVILHEAEPLFILPVTIEATTAKGIERRTNWIREEETAFSFDGEVSNPRVDPDGLLLLPR
ncbi:MAG: M1 family aminopeptidase [Candidatus Sulfotelmatobacter sp.]